jgi:8-oxo-dGTP diphosphatase
MLTSAPVIAASGRKPAMAFLAIAFLPSNIAGGDVAIAPNPDLCYHAAERRSSPMPPATVAAIMTQGDDADRILLTRREVEPFRGQWCLPGGHIERYEPARSAVIREAREETGLDFEARFLAYFDEIVPERGIHAVVLAFVGPATGKLVPSEAEVSEIAWFTLDQARALPLAFTHNEILDTYAG